MRALLLAALLAQPAYGAFPAGWTKQCKATIDHTKVPSSQSNFPVYVSDSNLLTNCSAILTTGGGAQSDGGDLRASTDAAGASQVPFEMAVLAQNANPALAVAEFHVKLNPSSSVDTDFYIWFNAGGGQTQPAANSTFGSQAVWSSYAGVWHLTTVTGSTGSVADSTGVNNGTPSGSPTNTTGKLGNAGAFAASSSQYVGAGTNSSLRTSAFTISCWMQTADTEALQGLMGNLDVVAGGVTLLYRGANAPSDRQDYVAATINGVLQVVYGSTGSFTANTWFYTVATYDGTTIKLYRNGAQESNIGSVSGTLSTSTIAFDLGRFNFAPGYYLNGKLDEARYANVALSSDWITTEYNNQNSPTTFLSIGAPATTAHPSGYAVIL